MTEGLSDVTVVFALVLALALLVERLLEVMKCGYDLLDSRRDWHRFWTRRAERLRRTLERKLRTLRFVKPEHLAALLAKFDDRFADGRVQQGRVPVVAGDLVRAATIKIAARVVGMAVGIALAFALQINLVTYWVEAGGPAPRGTWLHVAFTGAAIGLGSGPVHKVIRAVENRQKKQAARGGTL